MCFGNNPGCSCCQSLLIWNSSLVGDIVSRRTPSGINSSSTTSWRGAMFVAPLNSRMEVSDTVNPPQGEVYQHDASHPELRQLSRSYDVIYTAGQIPGTTKGAIYQSGVDEPFASDAGGYRWRKETDVPHGVLLDALTGLEGRQLSVGDHGLIHWNKQVAFWIDKKGEWVAEPKPLSGQVKIEGMPPIPLNPPPNTPTGFGDGSDFYGLPTVRLSPNSELAFIGATTIRVTDTTTGAVEIKHHLAIGPVSFVEGSGEYTVTVTPEWSAVNIYPGDFVPDEYFNKNAVFGRGKGGELYFYISAIHSSFGGDYLLAYRFPGMADAVNNQGWPTGDAWPALCMDFYPGDMVFFHRTGTSSGLPLATDGEWGTQHLDGTEVIVQMADLVHFHAYLPRDLRLIPAGGNYAIRDTGLLFWFDNYEKYFPHIEAEELESYETDQDVWLKVDHSGFFERTIIDTVHPLASAHREVDEGNSVLLGSSIAIDNPIRVGVALGSLTTETDGTQTAVFVVTFYGGSSLIGHADLTPVSVDDFVVHTCGTITHGTPTASGTAYDVMQITAPGILGGESGGEITVALKPPVALHEIGGGAQSSFLPVSASPLHAASHTIAPSP